MRVVSQVKVHVPRHLICSIKSPNQVVKWLKAFWNPSTYDGIRASQSRDTCFGSPCITTKPFLPFYPGKFEFFFFPPALRVAKCKLITIYTISGPTATRARSFTFSDALLHDLAACYDMSEGRHAPRGAVTLLLVPFEAPHVHMVFLCGVAGS